MSAKAKRSSISPSLRWSVFARDGFTCRYCGERAGENIQLVVDHVLSVKDGGDNHFDNLLSSCQRCNAGKGARSLSGVPVAADAVARAEKYTKNAEELASHMRAASAAKEMVSQEIVNIKCRAFGATECRLDSREVSAVSKLIVEFGAVLVEEWYECSAAAGVDERDCTRYLHGCARNARAKQ